MCEEIDMKATELRIGNFVNADENNWLNKKDPAYFESIGNYKISTINKSTVFIEHLGDLGSAIIEPDELKPIPITEEWLIKFGFVHKYHKSEHDYYNYWTVNHFELCVGNGFYYVEMEANMPYNPINHVHQLQNLYHALTGKELEL